MIICHKIDCLLKLVKSVQNFLSSGQLWLGVVVWGIPILQGHFPAGAGGRAGLKKSQIRSGEGSGKRAPRGLWESRVSMGDGAWLSFLCQVKLQ